MNDLKQEAAHQTTEPPVDRLRRRKVGRQHAPFAARARQIADGIDHFAQIGDATSSLQGGLATGGDERPLRIRQVARVTLARRTAHGLTRPGLLGPHDLLRLNAPLDIANRPKIEFSNRH